jgi:hypothetical protein
MDSDAEEDEDVYACPKHIWPRFADEEPDLSERALLRFLLGRSQYRTIDNVKDAYLTWSKQHDPLSTAIRDHAEARRKAEKVSARKVDSVT